MAQKTRIELQGLFKTGAKPSQQDFADFIESTLNIKDDGIEKPSSANSPLKITAQGKDEKLLDFYAGDKNTWSISQKSGEKQGFNISNSANSRLFIDSSSGNVGIGTSSPIASLDIASVTRTDAANHPKSVKGIYITGDFDPDSNGVEFRHTNGSQGIGFGYNTIYATGSNANQDLNLKPRGTGQVVISSGNLSIQQGKLNLLGSQQIVFTDIDTTNKLKLQLWTGYGLGINDSTLFYTANGKHSWRDHQNNERMLLTTGADGGLTVRGTGVSSFAGSLTISGSLTVKGAIQPSAGSTENNGIMFPKDPGGGSGGAAWIRYYSRDPNSPDPVLKEQTTLEIGTSNEPSDHIALMSSGGVGIGTINPVAKLEVVGGGGMSVDLIVNGRLRSNNNDGGLWIAADRFVGGFDTDKIGFWNNNAWRLTVQKDGNVGIGTNNPGAKLEVNGNLRVTGTLIFEQKPFVIKKYTLADNPRYKTEFVTNEWEAIIAGVDSSWTPTQAFNRMFLYMEPKDGFWQISGDINGVADNWTVFVLFIKKNWISGAF